jgi:hypothetical protein
VPATPERPATPTEPQQWQLHPTSETVAISHWPKIPNFVFADADRSAVPSLSEFDGPNGALVPLAEPFDRAARRGHGVPLPQQAPWPRQTSIAAASTAAALPIPAPAVFTIPELPHPTAEAVALLAPVATRTIVAGRDTDRAATPVNAGNSSRMTRGKLGSGRGGRLNASGPNQRGGIPVAAPARRSPLKHLVQVKKRNA